MKPSSRPNAHGDEEAARSRPLRMCVGASAGGHLAELLKLAPCWAGYPAFFVSTLPVVRERLSQCGRVYILGECDRRHPFRALSVLCRSVVVVWKERPDVVLTTGSLPLALLCLVARIGGARIIWIDSATNVTHLSLSGRLVRKFADLCLTQWPAVAKQYRGVEYVGAIV